MDKKRKKAETQDLASLQKTANELLSEIGEHTRKIDGLEDEFNGRVETLKFEYASEMQNLASLREAAEKALISLMKAEKKILFSGTDDVVSLTAGRLLYSKKEKVQIPRDAVETLEAKGFNDAIVIAKSVDRAVVESWTDAKLLLVGFKKKPKETFSYEVKNK